MKPRPIPLAMALAAAMPGAAPANSLISPGLHSGIARSALSASPAGEWNRLSRTDGKYVEVWTIDGDALNKVSFYGGIAAGRPLLREFDRKHQPLPRVKARMLITDIPALLESTYRSQSRVRQMSIDGLEPASLAGRKAIRFTYSFTRTDDEVQRKGEGIGALIGGKLYLVTYEAPALHFFDKDVDKYRQLTETLGL